MCRSRCRGRSRRRPRGRQRRAGRYHSHVGARDGDARARAAGYQSHHGATADGRRRGRSAGGRDERRAADDDGSARWHRVRGAAHDGHRRIRRRHGDADVGVAVGAAVRAVLVVGRVSGLRRRAVAATRRLRGRDKAARHLLRPRRAAGAVIARDPLVGDGLGLARAPDVRTADGAVAARIAVGRCGCSARAGIIRFRPRHRLVKRFWFTGWSVVHRWWPRWRWALARYPDAEDLDTRQVKGGKLWNRRPVELDVGYLGQVPNDDGLARRTG